ncbi:tRNA lysidine(34) synthetase TilS [Paracoccus ravus]|uniref:tRNA lysidine(34) synthetase TilS n=1 Tax=Paracoccus ravus TaxID=2447760 RepID=UPI00106EF5D9|nr:tRNA lysidine(34) synthetase TilS [Paracoccus ravus]
MGNDPVAGQRDDIPEHDPVARQVGAALTRLSGDLPRLGIALSGGGDSMALMHLARGWAQGRLLMAATVDHGLRPESADEARQAHRAATALSIPHATLLWQRDNEAGNLMAAARDARLRLLSGWAERNRLDAVLLGHTLDDQAETLLMRLARGSGVDGLAAMAESRIAFGMRWIRPMLGVSRGDLREWMTGRGIGWIDDPSNENEDYDRVRIRKALAGLNLPARQLAQSAANMAQARDALQDFAALTAEGATAQQGTLKLPWTAFRRAPLEIRRRLLVAGLRFVTGADYPPRRETLLNAISALNTAPRLTLEGVIVEPRGEWLQLYREPVAAARACSLSGQEIWDGRWLIKGLLPGQEVRALGHEPLPGLNWRASGMLRDEAAASPGIWQDGEILAAPALKPHPDYSAIPLRGLSQFIALLYTH